MTDSSTLYPFVQLLGISKIMSASEAKGASGGVSPATQSGSGPPDLSVLVSPVIEARLKAGDNSPSVGTKAMQDLLTSRNGVMGTATPAAVGATGQAGRCGESWVMPPGAHAMARVRAPGGALGPTPTTGRSGALPSIPRKQRLLRRLEAEVGFAEAPAAGVDEVKAVPAANEPSPGATGGQADDVAPTRRTATLDDAPDSPQLADVLRALQTPVTEAAAGAAETLEASEASEAGATVQAAQGSVEQSQREVAVCGAGDDKSRPQWGSEDEEEERQERGAFDGLSDTPLPARRAAAAAAAAWSGGGGEAPQRSAAGARTSTSPARNPAPALVLTKPSSCFSSAALPIQALPAQQQQQQGTHIVLGSEREGDPERVIVGIAAYAATPCWTGPAQQQAHMRQCLSGAAASGSATAFRQGPRALHRQGTPRRPQPPLGSSDPSSSTLPAEREDHHSESAVGFAMRRGLEDLPLDEVPTPVPVAAKGSNRKTSRTEGEAGFAVRLRSGLRVAWAILVALVCCSCCCRQGSRVTPANARQSGGPSDLPAWGPAAGARVGAGRICGAEGVVRARGEDVDVDVDLESSVHTRPRGTGAGSPRVRVTYYNGTSLVAPHQHQQHVLLTGAGILLTGSAGAMPSPAPFTASWADGRRFPPHLRLPYSDSHSSRPVGRGGRGGASASHAGMSTTAMAGIDTPDHVYHRRVPYASTRSVAGVSYRSAGTAIVTPHASPLTELRYGFAAADVGHVAPSASHATSRSRAGRRAGRVLQAGAEMGMGRGPTGGGLGGAGGAGRDDVACGTLAFTASGEQRDATVLPPYKASLAHQSSPYE